MARRRRNHIGPDEVCAEHFPGGVPAGTTSVGCTHGTFFVDAPDPGKGEGDGEGGQGDKGDGDKQGDGDTSGQGDKGDGDTSQQDA